MKNRARTRRIHPERLKGHLPHEKRVKLPKYGILKKRLDTAFSIFIRTRDREEDGLVPCITCSKRLPIKEIQCGHFQKRQFMATRWDERNCSSQCSRCNMPATYGGLGGEQYKHGLAIDKIYGPGTATLLEGLSRQARKFSRRELIELIEKYENKTAQLVASKVADGTELP